MFILKSQVFNDDELLQFACRQSQASGEKVEDKLLFWDFGPIMSMKYDQKSANYLFSSEKVPFHWDGAFYKEPRKILFYCTDSEGQGGETLFSDTHKIWNSLTPSEQELCRKVSLTYRTKKLAHYGGEITIPLVQTHPETGEVILRIAEKVETQLNPVELEIKGIEANEGQKLYDSLVAKLYDSNFMTIHEWEKGDLVICDNFRYLHGRKELGNNKQRSFKRIQIL